MNKEVARAAVDWMENHLPGEDKAYLLGVRDSKHLMGLAGRRTVVPRGWVAPIHTSKGMRLRNILREQGFGEPELGVANLDDVYEQLLDELLDRMLLEAGNKIYWTYQRGEEPEI